MKSVLKVLTNILRRGGFAFAYYPVSMIFAICLAVFSIWMILAEPQTNLKLIISLELSLAFGAFLGMACSVIAKKSDDKQSTFIIGNIIAVIITTGVFLMLNFSGGNEISTDGYLRLFSGIAISFLIFLLVPVYRSYRIHYNEMVNMTVKSFFISAVYALVIMLGSFFVAFAIQVLLYENLSSKVYAYIAIISGLIGYAFFLGYYPEFKKVESVDDERIEKGIKQARFAEILFQNIMIPIIAALTLVLFIWSIRILLTNDWPDYNQIISIFTTYSLVGLFIYYLVCSSDKMIARFYKKIIPYAILVFLAFEAYSIVNRIMLYGVKPLEYAIGFVWIYAAVSSVLFLFIPIKKNYIPSIVAIGLIAILVMPAIGINDASFKFQEMRLESILNNNSMIKDGKVVSSTKVSSKDKKDITDAVNYLYEQGNRKAPKWLLDSLPSTQTFSKTFGFDQEYYDSSSRPDQVFTYMSIRADKLAVALDGFQFFIARDNAQSFLETTVTTSAGDYNVTYGSNVSENKSGSESPNIIVTKDNKKIIDTNLDDFSKALDEKYFSKAASGNKQTDQIVPLEDLSFSVKGEGVMLELYFEYANYNDDGNGNKTYTYELFGILFKETK